MSGFEIDSDVVKSAKVVVRSTDGKREESHTFTNCTLSKAPHGMLVVVHASDAREEWFAFSTVLRVELER